MSGSAYGYGQDDPLNEVDPTGLWGIHIGPIKIGSDGCTLGTNPNGSCRGSNVKNDVAIGGLIAGAVALGVATGGIGDFALSGGLTLGTAAAAASAGAGIAVAYEDCKSDPGTPQCVLEAASAVIGTVGGGLGLAGDNLAATALKAGDEELQAFGEVMSGWGNVLFGVGALGYGVPTLFGDQLGLTGSASTTASMCPHS